MAECIFVQNFEVTTLNGYYNQSGTHAGEEFYIKLASTVEEDDYIMIYHLQYGPYSFSPAWYIMKIVQIQVGDSKASFNRPIPKYVPMAMLLDSDITSSGWISLSGEYIVGDALTTCPFYSSSSSSSDSSSSSSSIDIQV